MDITVTLNGKQYTLTPWELKNNAYYTKWDANAGDYWAGGAFYSFVSSGTILELKPIFRDIWVECKQNNVGWSSPRYVACEFTFSANNIPTTMRLQYELKYDPATPFVLTLRWVGQNVQQAQSGIISYRDVALHYEEHYPDEIYAQEETLAFYAIEQINNSLPTPGAVDYELSYTISSGAGGYLYNSCGDNWTFTGAPTYLWVNTPTNNWYLRWAYDADSADYRCYEEFNRAVNYIPAGMNNSQWTTGIITFNTALCTDIECNDVPWDITPDHSADDDDSDSNNFNNNFNDTSEYIPYDGVPVNSALDTNFIHAYLMTATMLRDLSDFMLSNDFVDNVKKLLDQPMDYIVSLLMLPIRPPASSTAHVMIGGVDSEVNGYVINDQWYVVDCGSVNVTEMWGGFLDYNGYSEVSVFLPFLGERQLDISTVMKGTLKLRYRIDLLTGIFIASLHCKNEHGFDVEAYQWQGQMGYSIPMSATNYTQKIMGIIGLASNLAMAGAGGAVNIPGMVGNAWQAIRAPHIDRVGNLSGDGSILGQYTPYIIVKRPVQQKPKYYNSLIGYPSETGGLLSNYTGFTIIEDIDLTGLSCTDDEKDEILADLKEGVFL